jgi:hypothetical protein
VVLSVLADLLTGWITQLGMEIDFPHFLAGLSPRDRELAMYLSMGHGGKRAAARFGVSAGRVSQLRRGWATAWRRFQGEDSIADRGTEFREPASAPR